MEFNGKNYSGWQKQPEQSTVQGEVEKALFKLFGAPIEAHGCSRTDGGVSAEEYVFHFDADTKLPEERVAFKLNRFLPKDIQAQKSVEVPPSMDARKSLKSKTYVYSVYSSPHKRPLLAHECVQVEQPLDLEKMREQAKALVGKHDFASFRTVGYESGADKKSTVRTLYSVEITEQEGVVKMYFCGDGFLYHMVRILAGTLVAVGTGEEKDLAALLNAKDRSLAGKTMPPKGLRLYRVEYPSPDKKTMP